MKRIILSRRSMGRHYEQCAEQYLVRQGFSVLQRNFQCRLGEIDLIMRQQQTLIFVEVRYRNNTAFGSACESVIVAKQQKICKTARYFLARFQQYQSFDCRFDIIGISQQGQQIEWIKNAFTE